MAVTVRIFAKMADVASNAVKIIDAINIVDEISKHVQLKPNKQEFLGLCPFHTEDTPSFYVNPTKQLFYCFGCQTGGNVINFRAKINGLTNSDAIEALAKDYHIPLCSIAPKTQGLTQVLEQASKYYQQTLKQHAGAMQYLQSRGLSDTTIEEYGVGYAPNGWNNLNTIVGFNVGGAKKIGLMVDNAKGGYDRFRHRVIFPIISHQGRIVGFGGRSLGDEKPKYINSSESEVYHKGQVLYGLYHTLKHKSRQLIVVEGYMDVISLHQAGITGAVASLGTAFTAGHFSLAARYGESLIFCFDGDVAGQNAAKKAFHAILPHMRDQLSCAFLTLPTNQDPDSYIQEHGKDTFKKLLETAVPFSDYMLNYIAPKNDPHHLEKQAQHIHHVRSLLTQMPDSILKSLITKKIGDVPTVTKRPQQSSQQTSHTQSFIELVLTHPRLITHNRETITPIVPVLPPLVQKALQSILDNRTTTLANFYATHNLSYTPPLHTKDHALNTEASALALSALLRHYQIEATNTKIQQLTQKSGQHPLSSDDANTLQKLLKVKHLMKKNKIILETCEDK